MKQVWVSSHLSHFYKRQKKNVNLIMKSNGDIYKDNANLCGVLQWCCEVNICLL